MSHTSPAAISVSRPVHLRRGRRENLADIDAALWAAYRKYDRSTVLEKLLQRHLQMRKNGRHQICPT